VTRFAPHRFRKKISKKLGRISADSAIFSLSGAHNAARGDTSNRCHRQQEPKMRFHKRFMAAAAILTFAATMSVASVGLCGVTGNVVVKNNSGTAVVVRVTPCNDREKSGWQSLSSGEEMIIFCGDRDNATTYLEAHRVGTEANEWQQEISTPQKQFKWTLNPVR
jgi:hypothetical protein